MIDDTHIVVYETKEIFYANKCVVHDGSIAYIHEYSATVFENRCGN